MINIYMVIRNMRIKVVYYLYKNYIIEIKLINY